MRAHRVTAMGVIAVLAVALAGCGGSGKETQTAAKSKLPQTVGAGEGALNLIAWNGYTESGKNDKTVDWVTPFEKSSGCKVNVKYGDTSSFADKSARFAFASISR